jgi:hypothetical protein
MSDKAPAPRPSGFAQKLVEGAQQNVVAEIHRQNGDEIYGGVIQRTADAFAAPLRRELTEDEIVVGVGGELAVTDLVDDDAGGEKYPSLYDVVKKPQLVHARATRDRLTLLNDVACVEQGLDAADTMQAQNSLERMLAHQLATSHAMAMRFMERAQSHLAGSHASDGNRAFSHSVEASRLAGTAARLMASYQEGLATLAKIRTGGRQVVKVIHQYVQVNEGGQAVVAGKLEKGRGGKSKQQGGKSK